MLNQKNFKDLVEEFKTFHQKNPEVYKMFVQFTLQAINRGHTKLSSEMVINRIRWETNVVTFSHDPYKINNDYKIVLNNIDAKILSQQIHIYHSHHILESDV